MFNTIQSKTKTEGNCMLIYTLAEDVGLTVTDFVFTVEMIAYGEIERKTVSDICESREEALRFFDRLYENSVLPVSLAEVAEDYVFEKTFVPSQEIL